MARRGTTFTAVMMVASQAAACFLGTTIVQQSNDGGCVVFAGAAALILLAVGWRSFRYGGEVIEGSGVGTRSKASGVGKSFLNLVTNR